MGWRDGCDRNGFVCDTELRPLHTVFSPLRFQVEGTNNVSLRKLVKKIKIRSPLIWFGGKSKVAKHIIDHMPPHRCYVEPFGGAAHVLAQKVPVDCEIYNDIDSELVNFLLVARKRIDKLVRELESLPYSRALYEKWKRETPPVDKLQRGVRFFYLNRSGIAKGNADSGLCTNTGWRHSHSTNTARAYNNAILLIKYFSERMRNVMIDNRDFREIIRVYDSPDTLFYCDPPYVGRERYYAGGFTEKDHRELAELLNNIKGKAIVSYYPDPLVHELYPHWRCETFLSFRQVVNGHNRNEEELLLMNFTDNQMNIFDFVELEGAL